MAASFDWASEVDQRRNAVTPLVVERALGPPSEHGSNGPFPARLQGDQSRWWVKPVPGAHGYGAGVAEIVVAAAGRLISAPTCEVRVVEIPLWLDGEALDDAGATLLAQTCIASREVPNALMVEALDFRTDDSNSQRHAGIFALWNWCFGGDPQWLADVAQENSTYSHDHGWWLPTGRNWLTALLPTYVNEAPTWPPDSPIGLSTAQLRRAANELDAVSEQNICEVVAQVPSSWPISNAKLVALGEFLVGRSPHAATHLRNLAASL